MTRETKNSKFVRGIASDKRLNKQGEGRKNNIKENLKWLRTGMNGEMAHSNWDRQRKG